MENYCAMQDGCGLLLAAVAAKVEAQSKLRQASAEWASKRSWMNKLYSSAVRLRNAQRAYFSLRTRESLISSKQAEDSFDKVLSAIASLAKPPPGGGTSVDDYIEGVKG